MKESKKIVILQSENKRPPKRAPSKKVVKEEITPEQEKQALQGQLHIDINSSTSDKEIMCPPIEEKIMTEPKQLKVYKPRENYLKEKITKLKYDEKLLNNIQKDLGSQIEEIKTQIKDNSILITQVPKDLNKYIIRSASTDNKIVKYSNEDYELKKKHKVIKELKDEEIALKKKLLKIEENEALLNNEGFIALSKSYEGITQFDKSIKEQHIKTIKNKKNDINERLKEIEFRIDLLLKEDNSKLTKREKLQNFKDTFERDKEIIEARANKYLKETKERNKRLANDINQLAEKRKKEIEKKEKDEQLKKEKIRKEFIEKEKAIEQKRLKEKEVIMLKYKPFINVKNEKTEKDYLFGIYDKRYQEKEQKLIEKINYERKLKSRTVTSEELQNFLTKVEEKKEQLKKEKEIKNKDELAKFEMAKNYKPSYISQFNENADEEYHKIREKEQIRRDEILALKGLKEDYSKNVRAKKQPGINEALKKERMDKILALENPKLLQIKDTLIKHKKNDDKDKKKKNDAWMSKLFRLEDKSENLNNSAIIQSNLIKKPKKIRFYSAKKKDEKENEKENDNKDIGKNKKKKIKKENESDKPTKFINYLEVLREEKIKNEKEKELRKKGLLPPEENNNKKNTSKKNKKKKQEENVVQKISNAKILASKLDKKAEMEEELLRVNGGVGNNPESGQKLSGYIVDSIKTKLNILNQLYKSQ